MDTQDVMTLDDIHHKCAVGDVVQCVSTSGDNFEEGLYYTVTVNDYTRRVGIRTRGGCFFGRGQQTFFRKVIPSSDSPSIQIKSDGGATDYYRIPEHATELRHLISAKGMSKSRGDIFKACYRLGEKDGTDVLYDLNKMKFFIEDLIEMHNRGEHL